MKLIRLLLLPLWLLGGATLCLAVLPSDYVAAAPAGDLYQVRYPSSPNNYYILYRGKSLDGPMRPVAMKLGETNYTEGVMRDTVPMRGAAYYRVKTVSQEETLDTDGDGLTDVEELKLADTQNPLNPAIVSAKDGAAIVVDRTQYEKLARRDNVPGMNNIREMKFLITNIDTDQPKLHLINTKRHTYHYWFYVFGLNNSTVSLKNFNSTTYFTNSKRTNLAGSLLAHDSFTDAHGRQGLYTMEFWPTDPVAFRFVETAFEMISSSLSFLEGNLAYHPAGETQRDRYDDDRAQFEASYIRTISTEELFGSLEYSALNPGITFGRLTIADGVTQTLTARDIVIFRNIPNDLTHVAGIITEIPQTPLSHINLKAKQNNTPNAYIKDATLDENIQALIGEYVLFEVTTDGYLLRRATEEQVTSFIESIRPREGQIPERDLSVHDIRQLGHFGFDENAAFGAKAANLSELRRILPARSVPHGHAIPFYFYTQFMRHNDLDDYVVRMLAIDGFYQDASLREAELTKLRKRVRNGAMPEWMLTQISELQSSFAAGTSLRCRSSTNNEDLAGFNGAGLYDSYTHHPDEGDLRQSVQQVWASMWNYRAFEERDFYRISQYQAAMGVIVHPNYNDEVANGVAVTKNIIDPNWTGYYVNVQIGEDLVTNPSANAIPDEFLVSLLLADPELGDYEFEVQYVRKSNRRKGDQPILAEDQVFELAGQLRLIQTHFRRLYHGNSDFGMEIEFKIAINGQLIIKQARPWID